MNRRTRLISAYGGRCSWCGSTGSLEFDHIHKDGWKHRREIGHYSADFERWLLREHGETGQWSPRIQLLCWRCHTRKSGRKARRAPFMPARPGARQHNVTLDHILSDQLLNLAAKPQFQGSKSAVVIEALRLYIEGTTSENVVDGLHQQISVLHSHNATALHALQNSCKAIQEELTVFQATLLALTYRLQAVEQQMALLIAPPQVPTNEPQHTNGHKRSRWRLWSTSTHE